MRLIKPLVVSAFVVSFALAAGGNALAEAAKPPTVDDLFALLNFSEEDKKAALSGQVVSVDDERLRDDQLIAAVAVPVNASLAELAEGLKSGKNIGGDSSTIEWGPVPTGDIADFKSLSFGDAESSEIKKLLKVKADSTFNLSGEEQSFLQEKLKGLASGDPATAQKAMDAYREVLAGRAKAYMEKGLGGVATYDHGDKELSPAEQLMAEQNSAEEFMSTHFPDFWKAFSNYPNDQSPDISSELYWINKRVESRPTFVLMHQMVQPGDGFLLVSQRQIYVGHDYESLQMFGLALPTDNGSMIFSVNAVFTNQITGFFSGMAQSVGQKRTRESMEKHFQAVQKEVQ